MKIEYTITEAVQFLQYCEDWNVDMDTIATDLSAKYIEIYNKRFKCAYSIEFELFILEETLQ